MCGMHSVCGTDFVLCVFTAIARLNLFRQLAEDATVKAERVSLERSHLEREIEDLEKKMGIDEGECKSLTESKIVDEAMNEDEASSSAHRLRGVGLFQFRMVDEGLAVNGTILLVGTEGLPSNFIQSSTGTSMIQ